MNKWTKEYGLPILAFFDPCAELKSEIALVRSLFLRHFVIVATALL